MMQKVTPFVRLAALIALLPLTAARAEFKLGDGDRVVFFGDTAVSEVNMLEPFDQFVRARYPERKPLVCNLGQPRGALTDARTRLEREVYPFNPTDVVLAFGLEGAARQAFNPAQLEANMVALEALVTELRGKDIRVTLLTPPPSEDGQSRGLQKVDYRGTIGKYAEAIRALGKKVDAPVIDWNEAVERHIKDFKSKKFPGWTRQGVIPSWYSHAILTDLLLEHWGAEPLDYQVSVDWKAGTASATIGEARVTESDATHLVLALKGAPAVVNMLGGQGMEPADWPLARWFKYRLQVTGVPEDRATISGDVDSPKTLTAAELAEGADMSTSGPLVNQPVTLKLHDAILRKGYQFIQFRAATENRPPEPELEEAFDLLYKAEAALALGAYRVAYRLPSSFDTTVRIQVGAVAAPPAASPQPAGAAAPRTGGKPPRPRAPRATPAPAGTDQP